MRIDIKKIKNRLVSMIIFITMFLLLSGIVYSATCQFRCAHCGWQIFAGCEMPPPSNGYCAQSPNGQHTFVFIKKH